MDQLPNAQVSVGKNFWMGSGFHGYVGGRIELAIKSSVVAEEIDRQTLFWIDKVLKMLTSDEFFHLFHHRML